MREVTLERLQNAYSRFKAYVYYDNFNLKLRLQLAEYEKDDNLEGKLEQLAIELTTYLQSGKLSRRLNKLIRESSYIVLPKSFSKNTNSQKRSSILISNKHSEDYKVFSTTKLFYGAIDLHLIATLWIVEEGVRLHKKIGDDSYGYHLPILPGENKLGPEKLLFTKYFEKYQEWRDKGITAAKKQIESGNDVLLMSLDIKSFFHSTHIDFEELKKDLRLKYSYTLTDLIEVICKEHTRKLSLPNREGDKPLLPIGLVSSGVIANWFLSEFDKEIKERIAPVFYGRYVDDIFIVVSNVKPPHNDSDEDGQDESITKRTIGWIENRFFPEKKPLYASEDSRTLNFSNSKKYKGLEIQADKLKLFYFSPDWPHAMLNKFQKALEENSSAFWFLPDEEDMTESLDDEAYDMQYEDTINKFRSVADVKTSKYGASVFLAKRIKLAILHSGSPDDKITKEVFRFFKGVSTLALYNLWEKIFSYLVVTNDVTAIKRLHGDILKAITKMKADEDRDYLAKALNEHLNICLEMSFSLNPKLVDWFAKNDEKFNKKSKEIKKGIRDLRYALLTRHSYLPLPSLVLSDFYINTEESLLSEGLLEKLLDEKSKFELNDKLNKEIWRIPRWVYLQEVSMFYFLFELKTHKPNEGQKPYYSISFGTDYIKKCKDLFERLNKNKITKSLSSKRFKIYQDGSKKMLISTDTITLQSKKETSSLMLGLSNMRLEESDLKAAISKRSLINKDKRKKHIQHLNLAEQEKIDLLILPETAVPIDWLYAYADEARRKGRAFIFGLEHFTLRKYCFNFSITILPFEQGNMKEVLILPRLKNHYSPMECVAIKKIGKYVPLPLPSYYHLIKWRGIQFTVYNCYELADVVHRSIFRSHIDILFAIEYNKDTNYFSNIAEATCRDLHCYFVQANTSEYGDSRVVEPRETEKMNPLRVKGGENNVILRYKLNIEALRAFQIERLPYQLMNKSFKTTPPDFDHDKVNERGA